MKFKSDMDKLEKKIENLAGPKIPVKVFRETDLDGIAAARAAGYHLIIVSGVPGQSGPVEHETSPGQWEPFNYDAINTK